MKNFINLILVVSCLISKLSVAQQIDEADSLHCLLIKGKIKTNLKKDSSHYYVQLLHNNTVVASAEVKKNGKFNFLLTRNTYYAIKIISDNHVPRIISINTWILDDIQDVCEFSFATTLIEKEKSAHLNQDALDFPIACIYFEKNTEQFIYAKEYTEQIKKELTEVSQQEQVAKNH